MITEHLNAFQHQPTHEMSDTNKSEMQRRMFPIQDGPSVPWEVMAPHESTSQSNHSQSLARVAERGGFSSAEAWCIVSGINRPGMAGREQWDKWKKEWFSFAESTNIRYSSVEQENAELRMALSHYKNNPAPHGTPLVELEESDRLWKELEALPFRVDITYHMGQPRITHAEPLKIQVAKFIASEKSTMSTNPTKG